MKKMALTLVLLSLSACASQDMQGEDPRDYYAEHPIANTIQTRDKTIMIHYASGQSRLSPAEIDKLDGNLHAVSMPAVESIQIGYPYGETMSAERKLHLTKMLHNMGYEKNEYTYQPVPALKSGEVQLDMVYAVVISPDCPDWRTSPVTTHSNTKQGNFSCATQVNLGLMVADPHDLVRGTGDVPVDTVNATKAIQEYHAPAGAAAPASSAAPAAAGGGGSSAPPATSGTTGQ